MNAYLVDDLTITPIQENWLEDIGTTEKHKSIFESIKTPIKTPGGPKTPGKVDHLGGERSVASQCTVKYNLSRVASSEVNRKRVSKLM